MGLLPGASPAFLVRSVSILRRSHYGVFKQLCRDITGSVTAAGPSSTYLKKRGSRSCEAEGTPVISPSSQEITRSWSDRAQVLQTLQSSAGPVKKKKKKHKAKLSDIPRDAARYLASSKNSSASQPLDSPTSDADLERTADKRKFKDRKEGCVFLTSSCPKS
jgi:hypothetical protein